MLERRSTPGGWRISALTLALAASLMSGGCGSEPAAAPERGPLDGLAFVGETGRHIGDKASTAHFAFGDGLFRASPFAEEYGFSAGKYTSAVIDGVPHFAAAVVSHRSGGGSMVWEGTLRGDVLEGTMRWDHGWESRTHWFRGRATATTTASR